MKSIDIPQQVDFVLEYLEDAGYEAFLVGGLVRDALHGKKSTDFDIATDALPSEIREVFASYNIMDYGEEHGTISIYHEIDNEGYTYEITTYREEENYSDGRRPDNVEFVKSLRTDLSRRDFTINALAADKEGNIIDYFNGIEDFHNEIIRAVGDPKRRFEEDSLRVLRAVRFALRLDFNIERETKKAIRESAELLLEHSISGERILSELKEILQYHSSIQLLTELDLLPVLFPKITDYNHLTSQAQKINGDESEQRWSVLLYYSYQENTSTQEKISHAETIFKKYPGLGKQKEEYIIHLSLNMNPPTHIFQKAGNQHRLRWMIKALNNLERFPEFDTLQYFQDLTNLLEIMNPELEIHKEKSNIYSLIEKIDINLPVNGNDAKELSFQGRQIGKMINLWKWFSRRNENVVKQDYIDYANKIKHQKVISLTSLRMEISDNHPIYKNEEQKFLEQIIKELNLLSSHSILLVIVNEEEYRNLTSDFISNALVKTTKERKEITQVLKKLSKEIQKENKEIVILKIPEELKNDDINLMKIIDQYNLT